MIIVRGKKRITEDAGWEGICLHDLTCMFPISGKEGKLFLAMPGGSHVDWLVSGMVNAHDRVRIVSRAGPDFDLYFKDIETAKIRQNRDGGVKEICFTLKGKTSLGVAWY